MANIKDVANLAGVSVATVSRFLNSKGYISERAKKVIQQAIDELDYKPNLVARSLSTKQANIIGFLLTDITNPFFAELARAVEDVCIDKGYAIILCNTDNDIDKAKMYIELLKQKYVAGMVITTNLLSEAIYEKLDFPIVGVDRVNDVSFSTVKVDNFLGGQLAAQHLIDKGCRHILLLRGVDSTSILERVAGFLAYANDFEKVKVDVVPSYFQYDKTFAFVKEVLSPAHDGIFACSDVDGVAAIKAATALGYTVPEQLQIIGFDGVLIGELTSPSLTTIAQNIYEIGTVAAERLIAHIEQQDTTATHIVIAPYVVERDSTKKVSQ